MSTVAAVTPFEDRSRGRRLGKIAIWLVAIALLLVALDVFGVDVRGWLSEFWDSLTSISLKYIVAGCALQTVQTTLIGFSWYAILKAGFPNSRVRYLPILAAYAAGISLNNFLPASLGTVTSLLMYTALIAGATFSGILGATVVQKIFFTLSGAFVYLYLFVSVPESFRLQLEWVHDHKGLTVLLIAGGAVLVLLLVRVFWQKLKGLWENAKQGGAILARPRDYFIRVFAPSFVAWCAKLGVIAVFLAAYSIPVTFHTVMSVAGGNSISSTLSVTPGGVGVTQAVNVASLKDVTDPATAAAYSVGQQLIMTVWNALFAIVIVVWAFGWTGGKELVGGSYGEAREKVTEQKAQRAAKKVARREEEEESGEGLVDRMRGSIHRDREEDEDS